MSLNSSESSAEEATTDTMSTQPPMPENPITIGISSRVLFNMEEEQKIFEQRGLEANIEYQVAPEVVICSPGPAFSFIKSWSQVLNAVNAQLKELYPESKELFNVVLMSHNHPHVGLRLINSINHHEMLIERFCLTGGTSPSGYLKAYETKLYLSADSAEVREALKEGIAAATVFTPKDMTKVSETQLRVAFDGDGVLFSDESEQIYKRDKLKSCGLDAFLEHEMENENNPMGHGPLKGFLEVLVKLQKKFHAKGKRVDCPIRTYLVTSRSAGSPGARALTTLNSWGLEVDEAHFLSGAPKGPILGIIRPHIFFDDQIRHVNGAVAMGTVAGHVPYEKFNNP